MIPNLHTLERIAKGLQAADYLLVASNMLFIYDYLLMFGQEVSLIWPSRWSFVKVVYLLSRYMPFLDIGLTSYHQFATDMTTEDCTDIYKVNAWMYVLGMALSEAVLAFRLWVIWNKDRRLTIGLPIFFAATWVPSFGITYVFVTSLKFTKIPVKPLYRGCLFLSGSRVISVSWVMLLLYNTGTLTLLVVRATSLYWSGVDSRLLKRLYRDGVLYFLALFVFSVINVIVIFSFPPSFVNILSSTLRALHSNLSSRLILDIRNEVSKAADRVEIPLAHSTT